MKRKYNSYDEYLQVAYEEQAERWRRIVAERERQ
jgi:hypothetical protein